MPAASFRPTSSFARRSIALIAAMAALALGSGCSCTAPILDGDGGLDTGGVDGSTTDGGPIDGGPIDGGDAPGFDGGELDGGTGFDGGDFDAGTDFDGGTDAGTNFDGGTDAGGADAGTDAGGTDAGGTDAGIDAGPACGTLPANPTDVYVDGLATLPEVGTMACPFHTILGALGLPAPTSVTRTVHVRGRPTGLLYLEARTVVVPARIIVEGDGRSQVSVATSAPTTCIGSARCVVEVRGGGVLRALSVIPVPGGLPGTADGVAFTNATPGIGSPTAEDVNSENHGGSAFHSGASAVLRGVRGVGTQNGLLADTGTVTLTVEALGSTRSVFDGNRSHGIRVDAGLASIRNCTASQNGSIGIALLATTSPDGLAGHSVTGCTANMNGITSSGSAAGVGIRVGLGASASITGSTMLGNSGAGLVFERATVPAPSSISLSCNVFAVPGSPAMNNGRAGLCAENTGATGGITFRLNVFSTATPACPGMQREMSAEETCLALAPGYSDLVYERASGGGVNPFNPLACDYCP
jgi:hypothetical protein